MTSPDYLVSPNKEQLEDVADILARDYRLSFKFSQGNASLQQRLFYLLGAQYRQNYEDQHLASLKGITAWKELSRVPQLHADVDIEHIERETNIQTTRFYECLTNPDLTWLIEDPALYIDFTNTALHLILRKERKYFHTTAIYSHPNWNHPSGIEYIDMGIGRPKRLPPVKYESQVKKYIIDQRPTGSVAYDTIFHDMRTIASIWHTPALDELAQIWEEKHPGRDFFSEEYLASRYQLDDTPTLAATVEALEKRKQKTIKSIGSQTLWRLYPHDK